MNCDEQGGPLLFRNGYFSENEKVGRRPGPPAHFHAQVMNRRPALGSLDVTAADTDIGNIEFRSKLILAPMAGLTDTTFRRLCRENGADIVMTETVSALGVSEAIPVRSGRHFTYDASEHPLGLNCLDRTLARWLRLPWRWLGWGLIFWTSTSAARRAR